MEERVRDALANPRSVPAVRDLDRRRKPRGTAMSTWLYEQTRGARVAVRRPRG